MRGLILAAGLGERLRPLTTVRAKPAIEFLNVPMLAFPYHWMSALGLTDLTFNTHHLPDTVRVAAMHVAAPEVALHFTHEPAILGAGGGIWNARFNLGGDTFVVANGDAVMLGARPDLLVEMKRFHEERDALATLLVCPLDGVGTRIPGVWMTKDGRVTGFGKERPDAESTCLHYASFMLLSSRVWEDFPEGNSNILYDVLLPRLQAGDGVYGYRADDVKWFETGNARDYLAATEACLKELRDQTALGRPLATLLERYGPTYGARSDLDQLHLIADGAEVDSSVALKGFGVIGDGARLGAYAKLERSVVLPGARVDSGDVRRDDVVIG